MPICESLPKARTVTTRRIAFDHPSHPRKHFFDDDLMMSHILAVLSSTFPKGEHFFVESVRNVRAHVTDPVLRDQVAGFIGQEAMHSREHARLNRALAELGYPTGMIDRATGVVLGVLRRVAPKPVQLATTAALEHFTAVLAEQLLEDEAFDAVDLPEPMRDLFRWHALEECEHKAVAFDVFQERCGNEAVRIAAMQGATALIVLFALPLLALSVASDPSARRPLRLARSLAGLRRSPFARRRIALNLLQYNRPGFHPDDRDTEVLVAHWRDELFGAGGQLTARLQQATA